MLDGDRLWPPASKVAVGQPLRPLHPVLSLQTDFSSIRESDPKELLLRVQNGIIEPSSLTKTLHGVVSTDPTSLGFPISSSFCFEDGH